MGYSDPIIFLSRGGTLLPPSYADGSTSMTSSYSEGSFTHWEGHGAIWGQTFSGYVDEASGVLDIMYPTISSDMKVGSINLASRDWDQPFSHGFWVSAPRAASLAICTKTLLWFELNMTLSLPRSGAGAAAAAAAAAGAGDNGSRSHNGGDGGGGGWALRWNHQAPIGATEAQSGDNAAHSMNAGECHSGFGTGASAAKVLPWCTAIASNTALVFDGSGKYTLVHATSNGSTALLSGTYPATASAPLHLKVKQHLRRGTRRRSSTVYGDGGSDAGRHADDGGSGDVAVIQISVDGQPWTSATIASADAGGNIAVHADAGTSVGVSEMLVEEVQEASQQQWVTLLPSDGMTNVFNQADRGFKASADPHFRYGAGFVHPGAPTWWGYADRQKLEVPMYKFNFIGVAAKVWLPTGPRFGFISISVDGNPPHNISLYSPTNKSSSVVWQWKETAAGKGGPRMQAGNPATGSGGGAGHGGDGDGDGDGGGPQQLSHAHAVTVRWRAPPPPPPAFWSSPPRAPSSPPPSTAAPAAPAQGTWFPVDAFDYLPPFGTPADDGGINATISNISPRRDSSGTIVNAHDGALVQDALSGAFYLYGISFPDSCTRSEYDNCVSAGSCMQASMLVLLRVVVVGGHPPSPGMQSVGPWQA